MVSPTHILAAGSTEILRDHYLCPVDPDTQEIIATNLSECTWEGMYFKPCTGTAVIEGTLTGNYKMTVTEHCVTSNSWNSCETGIMCEWTMTENGWKLVCASYVEGGCLN